MLVQTIAVACNFIAGLHDDIRQDQGTSLRLAINLRQSAATFFQIDYETLEIFNLLIRVKLVVYAMTLH